MRRVVGGVGRQPIIVHVEGMLTKPAPDWSTGTIRMSREKGNVDATVNNVFSLMTRGTSEWARMEMSEGTRRMDLTTIRTR